jgi:hypothetical protein
VKQLDGTNWKDQNRKAEAVDLDFHLSLPMFSINLRKLKLSRDGKQVHEPAVFEDWVSLELQDMKVVLETRLYDSALKLTLKQISMIDQTMVANKTLLFHEKQDESRKVLTVMSASQQAESPKFRGLLSYTQVELADVRLNFMPSTINMILKFFAAKRLSTLPVDDHFLIAEEYPPDFEHPQDHTVE